MDKRVIKEFSIMARNELIKQITRMANSFGVFEDKNGRVEYGNDYVIINGKTYPKSYAAAYNKLIEVKKEKGFEELIEEVAYTWFNRFIALRFMEVNDYLPSHIRVLSSAKGKVDPDIVENYEEADLDIKFDEIYKLINIDKNTELAYRKLLIAQCNKLSNLMPFLFEKINDYTEMLLPDNLLIPQSIISKLVATISEDDFKEEVEIIGWIYQYYISEKKDKVFADLKKNIKISKENIPAATQLFTPKWIVKYMVENSLGRLWLEGHPNEELQKEWKYYLEEAEQEPEVEEELQKIKDEHAKLTPEDIKILDPCMGSGHILVYAFDVLYEIYKTAGYPSGDIPKLILKNNLYGLDIDDRAAQLASFALVMKARQYNKKIFKQIEEENIELNLCSIQESKGIEEDAIDYFCSLDNGLDNKELKKELEYIRISFTDAKNLGSLIKTKSISFKNIEITLNQIEKEIIPLNLKESIQFLKQRVELLIKQAMILNTKYHICITNPPYVGRKGMNKNLTNYIDKHYENSKHDLYSIFIQWCIEKSSIYTSMITQHTWMFLSSFAKLREMLAKDYQLMNLCHIGSKGFEELNGEVVQTVIFTIGNYNNKEYKLISKRLVKSENKERDFLYKKNNKYINKVKEFEQLPGNILAYWISERTRQVFTKEEKLIKYMKPLAGISSGNNEKMIRLWYEVNEENINQVGMINKGESVLKRKWFFHNKGGEFRKWYGNLNYIFNYTAESIKYMEKLPGFRHDNKNNYFKGGLNWAKMSSGKMGVRYTEGGCMFDSAGTSGFPTKNCYYIQGLLNSKVATEIFSILNPTLSIVPGNVADFPTIICWDKLEQIEELVQECNKVSKRDWENFETARSFKGNCFFSKLSDNKIYKLSSAYLSWETECNKDFTKLKNLEENLNRIFIDIYGLQDELTPEINDKDITIRRADRERDIKSLISYAVGCIFGRYSIDAEGLIYAGGNFTDKWNIEEKKVRKIEKDEDGNIVSDTWVDTTFIPDKDNTIPITENEYFDDDIVARFVEFIRTVYGEDTLEENLDFIADTLVKRNSESSVERIRRYFVDEFYKDHCKIYQKRPIYWMIDSVKNKGFRALIYLHRYNKETLSNVRLNYLLELQGKYLNEQKQIERYLDSSSISTAEKKKRNKELQILSQKQSEILAFDKVLDEFANKQIELDLDDGVVVNYGKLQQVLAKIK